MASPEIPTGFHSYEPGVSLPESTDNCGATPPAAMAGWPGQPDVTSDRSPAAEELLARCLPIELARLARAPGGPGPAERIAIEAHLGRLCTALSAAVPRWLANALRDGAVTPARRTQATLLFADVTGFTPLTERLSALGRGGAEQLTLALNRVFAAIVGVALAHDGDLLAFGGDAVLVGFEGSERLPQAMAAAAAMQAAMPEVSRLRIAGHPLALQVKIGIADGPALLLGAGTAERRLALALGDVLDEADAMAARTAPGAIGLAPGAAHAAAAFARLDTAPDGSALLIEGLRGATPAELMPVLPVPADGAALVAEIAKLRPYLPADIFASLAADPDTRPGEGEQREVISLFIHLAGLHALADTLGQERPELATSLVDEVIALALGTIEQHGGALAHADIYSGGLKLLAFFGAPVARERDAQRAVQAALVLRERITAQRGAALAGAPLAVRMGINAGRVIAGLIGVPARWEYTVIGSATNIAARLMGAGELGRAEILVGPRVQAQLGPQLSGAPRTLQLKGVRAPVVALAVDALRAAHAGSTLERAPLVGREAELARLTRAAVAIERGQGRLVFLQGEAGVGKSRLARELAAGLGDRLTCLTTPPPGLAPPSFAIFRGLLAALADLVDVPGSSPAARGQELLAALVPTQAAELWPALAVLLGLPEAQPDALGDDPLAQQRTLARAVRAVLLAATARHPLVWICEDLHEADTASLELIEQLIGYGGMHRLLLCTMLRPPGERGEVARPVERVIAAARRAYGDDVELLTLEGLDAQAGARLLEMLVPGLTPAAREAILAHTGGNPLFIELLLEALWQQDALKPGSDGVRLRTSLERLQIPLTLGELVTAQIDRLPPEARRLAQAAAVIAAVEREVAPWLLERIVETTATAVAAHLDELVRARLLERAGRPEDEALHFRHALFQQMAYGRLLDSRRVEYHRRAGRALHALGPATGDARIAALATHCYEGRDWELAVDYVLEVGRRAREIYANREARRALLRALGLAHRLGRPAVAGAAREGLGAIHALGGSYALARAQLEAALAAGGPPEAIARRRRLLARVAERVGEYETALDHCRAGLELAAGPGLPAREVARLHAQRADVLLRRGDFTAAEEACRSGLAVLPPEEASRERVTLLQRLATIDGLRGGYGEAAAGLIQSLALARGVGDPGLTAAVLHNLGRTSFNLGRTDDAARCYAESLQLKEQIGDTAGRLMTINSLGIVELARGEPDAALRAFDEAHALATALGMPGEAALAQMNIGQLQYERGRFAEAAASYEHALAALTELDDASNLADCSYKLGDVALARGDAEAALRHGAAARDIALRIGSVLYESCARRVLGEALLLRGELAAATAELNRAAELQETVGDPFDTALIRAAQARLAQRAGDSAQARALVVATLPLARDQRITFLVEALERLAAELGMEQRWVE